MIDWYIDALDESPAHGEAVAEMGIGAWACGRCRREFTGRRDLWYIDLMRGDKSLIADWRDTTEPDWCMCDRCAHREFEEFEEELQAESDEQHASDSADAERWYHG